MTADELRARALPGHVAVIMDGNGRWAKQKGLPRTAGHREGLTAAKRIVAAAASLGIRQVTLYTFSTENWKRAQEEVGYLMGLIKSHLRAEFDFYKKNGIRIAHIGNLDGLPADVRDEIRRAREDTARFTGTTCALAINYGARDELTRAVRSLAARSAAITEEAIAGALDVTTDVDLLIRTGGEQRLSNFLLWQAAYAELIFTDTLWPDYTEEMFFGHIEAFQKRSRRFGAVPGQ